jgi:hypothetical protein
MYNQPDQLKDISKVQTATVEVRTVRPPDGIDSIRLVGSEKPIRIDASDAMFKGLSFFDIERYNRLGIQVGPKQFEPLAKVWPRLNSSSRSALGANGISRFESFRLNQAGWYFGSGEPLNYESVQQFNKFFALVKIPPTSHPSIFLSEHGNLALGWENNIAGSIELEFGPSVVRYSFEKLDDEGESEFGELLSRFVDVLQSA